MTWCTLLEKRTNVENLLEMIILICTLSSGEEGS